MQNVHEYEKDAFATSAAMCGDKAAFAFGDGDIVLLDSSFDKPKTYQASKGIIHTIGAQQDNFIFGDEQGYLKTLSQDNIIETIHQFKNEWVEKIIFNSRLRTSMAIAGKTIALWNGKELSQHADHPSSVGDAVFASKGTRIAAAHYNGITQWIVGKDKPLKKDVWKGSHISITWSPDQKFIITGTQEMQLHVFDLARNEHLYMSGYYNKVRSLSWNAKGNLLFTSGSTQVLGWNFSGKGPGGKKAVVLGPNSTTLITKVACHPSKDILAAGYENGVILLMDIVTDHYVLAVDKKDDSISFCKWDQNGSHLLYGTKNGTYGIITMPS